MKPQDFVLFDGDSSPNTPVQDIYIAMQKTIEIHSADADFKVVGYYYDSNKKCMVLDIQQKRKHKLEK